MDKLVDDMELSFDIASTLKSDEENLKKLQFLMNYIDAHIITKEMQNGYKLTINFNIDNARKKMYRRAGRHQKFIGVVPVDEVREMMKEIGADETAKKLGIGTATLYRRLKKAESLGLNNL